MALMKYTAHVLVAGWLLAVCATGQASAANVKLVNFYNNQVAIAFEGDIVVGDFERFGQVGEQALALGKPAAGIWLNSGGGDFGEAAKFADKLFSLREAVADKPGAAAVVGFEQTCASACFLIFACTQHRIADASAHIGVHSARNSNNNKEDIYSYAADTAMARIAKQCGVPGYLIAKMVTTPADSMYWLTELDLHSMGVDVKPSDHVLALPGYPGSERGVASPALPQQNPTGSGKRPFHVVNADDGHLNIPMGPGLNYDVVAEMPLGETGLVGKCVRLDGGYLPFCEVEWRGTTGWASSCCISVQQPAVSANGLNLFCANKSYPGDDDGVIVQATKSNAGWRLHVIHKVSGQFYDRNVQYQIFAYRQSKSGPSNYYLDGVLIKDRNVLMTGHLWLNSSVWFYNEYVSFQDGSQPVKTATSTIACQLRQD
jgi:hypothetical protein